MDFKNLPKVILLIIRSKRIITATTGQTSSALILTALHGDSSIPIL